MGEEEEGDEALTAERQGDRRNLARARRLGRSRARRAVIETSSRAKRREAEREQKAG